MSKPKKNINRFDSFTKCRSAVVGKINWTLLDLIDDPIKRDYAKGCMEDLDQTFDYILKLYEQFEIQVDRPNIVPYNPDKKYVHPNFELAAIKNPISTSDSFLCLADTIVEVPSIQENAFYDYVQYREIWNEYFDNGSKWIAAPIPTHDPKQFDGVDYYDWAEILFDAPCIEPVGDRAFCAKRTVFNTRAKKWLERTFPQFTFEYVEETQGHLDSYFRILKPGLVYSALPKSLLPDCFHNWTVIQTTKTEYQPPEIVSEFLQDDDYENTVLDVNGFSIDEENFCMMSHVIDNHPDVVKQIESHGINCIPVPFDSCRFVNLGLSCITHATQRDGQLQNYFK